MEKLNLQSSRWCARHLHQSGTHLAATISTLIPQWIQLLEDYFAVVFVISQVEILVQGQHPSESLSHFVVVVGCSACRRDVHTGRVRRQGQLHDIRALPSHFFFFKSEKSRQVLRSAESLNKLPSHDHGYTMRTPLSARQPRDNGVLTIPASGAAGQEVVRISVGLARFLCLPSWISKSLLGPVANLLPFDCRKEQGTQPTEGGRTSKSDSPKFGPSPVPCSLRAKAVTSLWPTISSATATPLPRLNVVYSQRKGHRAFSPGHSLTAQDKL